jgi:hypothetical protein
MFDNTKPNIILLSDKTSEFEMNRTLGIYKLAHCLREAGFEVAVLHFLSMFTIDEVKHALTHLLSDKTLFVGVSNFFYESIDDVKVDKQGHIIKLKPMDPGCILPHGKKFNKPIKNLIKGLSPNCKLVVGGPTALDTSYNNIFDFVIVGYAEISAVELAKHLQEPSSELSISNYKSIYGPIIVNDAKAEKYNFNQSSMSYSDQDAILPNESLMLEIGRGCIFKCAFCSHPLNGKKQLDYIRDHSLIRQELVQNYEMFGTTNYLIIDDTFNDSVEKCKEFYEMVKTLPFKINWWGYIRLDLMAAHPETIEYLFESGLRAAFFGIETLDPKIGAKIGKGGTRKKLFDTIDYIKNKYGNRVSLHGSFIFGLPNESIDSMRDSAEFLLSDNNHLDSWMVEVCRISSPDRNYAHGFQSDIDVNYKKYGYVNQDENIQKNTPAEKKLHELKGMRWKNEFTSREQVEQLVAEVHSVQNSKMSGAISFYLAGLGIPVDVLLNKKRSEHNWYAYSCIKLKRGQQYKKMLFSKLGIPIVLSDLSSVQSYSDLLTSGLLTKEHQ